MSEQAGNGVTTSEAGLARPELLQQAREAAGLHIAALAAALKVPVRKLEALEAGRYDELPDLVFARALASSACRHLKIDSAPVLAQIPQERRSALVPPTQSLDTPFRSSRPGGGSVGTGARPALKVWWLAAALLLGALALYFWPAGLRDSVPVEPPVVLPQDAPVPAEADPQPAEEPAAPAPDSGPALPLLVPTSPSGLAIEASPAPALPPAGPPVAESQQPATGVADASRLLVIRAREESWVEVLNGTGTVLVQRVLRAGDSVEFSTAPPYRVVIGRSDGVDVFVRGRAFDVLPHARNNVARFEVR